MKKKLITYLAAITVLLGGGYAVGDNLGGTSYNHVETKAVLSSISATTTSSAIDISGADRVTLSFNVAGVYGSGKATSTFTVTASADGDNYVTFNKLVDNVANSISQDITRVSSIAIDSNSTKIYSLDLSSDNFKFIKVTDTINGTTTSAVTVKALINY